MILRDLPDLHRPTGGPDEPGGPGDDGPGPGGRPPQGNLRRTSPTFLIIVGLVGALLGWTIAVVTGRDGAPIRVAWSGPVTLLAAAAVLVCIAYVLHLRLQVNRIRIPDRQAVAWLALGKAAAVVGALMAGGYFGFGVRFVADLATDAPRERVIRSIVAIVGGVAITLAGLRIERACLVPPDDRKPKGGNSDRESDQG